MASKEDINASLIGLSTNTRRITLAALTQELPGISAEDAHVVELTPVNITAQEFKQLFYPNGDKFQLAKFESLSGSLQQKLLLKNQKIYDAACNKIIDFNLVTTIQTNLATDLDLNTNCWDSCSLIELQKNLTEVQSFLDVGNSCNICAMNYNEYLGILQGLGVDLISVTDSSNYVTGVCPYVNKESVLTSVKCSPKINTLEFTKNSTFIKNVICPIGVAGEVNGTSILESELPCLNSENCACGTTFSNSAVVGRCGFWLGDVEGNLNVLYGTTSPGFCNIADDEECENNGPLNWLSSWFRPKERCCAPWIRVPFLFKDKNECILDNWCKKISSDYNNKGCSYKPHSAAYYAQAAVFTECGLEPFWASGQNINDIRSLPPPINYNSSLYPYGVLGGLYYQIIELLIELDTLTKSSNHSEGDKICHLVFKIADLLERLQVTTTQWSSLFSYQQVALSLVFKSPNVDAKDTIIKPIFNVNWCTGSGSLTFGTAPANPETTLFLEEILKNCNTVNKHISSRQNTFIGSVKTNILDVTASLLDIILSPLELIETLTTTLVSSNDALSKLEQETASDNTNKTTLEDEITALSSQLDDDSITGDVLTTVKSTYNNKKLLLDNLLKHITNNNFSIDTLKSSIISGEQHLGWATALKDSGFNDTSANQIYKMIVSIDNLLHGHTDLVEEITGFNMSTLSGSNSRVKFLNSDTARVMVSLIESYKDNNELWKSNIGFSKAMESIKMETSDIMLLNKITTTSTALLDNIENGIVAVLNLPETLFNAFMTSLKQLINSLFGNIFNNCDDCEELENIIQDLIFRNGDVYKKLNNSLLQFECRPYIPNPQLPAICSQNSSYSRN